MLILRNKKFILTVFILMAIFMVGQTDIIYAEEVAKPAINQAKEVTGLLSIVANLTAKILTLIAGLVDFATRLGNNVMDLAAVKIGWQVVLGFTNLGFVLAIIVIAFATIFRMQSYAIKQTLWKLIVAALLVNFSLVIAGAIISVSNTVSNTMINAAMGPGGNNLSNALANAVNPAAFGEIKKPDAGFWERVTNALNEFFEFIAGLIFIIIFSFFIILAFASLFIMLLVRAIALVFLLILSPVIWLLWIFPGTQSYWHKWWSEFIRWNFFAPAVFFFIYLAIATASCMNSNQICSVTGQSGVALSSITDAKKTADSAADVFNKTSIVGKKSDEIQQSVGIFEHIANLFVVLSLLFGGIFVANKFSIAGGGMGVKIGQSTGKAFGGWAGRKGVRTAGWGFAGPSPRTQQWAQQGGLKGMLGKADVAVRGRLNRIPVLKNLGQQYRKKGEHKNLAASVWGGIKSGSGLFKARGERKEKAEAALGRLYTKKTALQGELDLLQKAAPGTLNLAQQQRLTDLSGEINKVDTKIKELEEQAGEVKKTEPKKEEKKDFLNMEIPE